MDIRCRKISCKFNDRFTCKAKNIEIDKKVICSTFENDDTKKNLQDVTKNFFEQKPDFAPQRDSKTIDINCNTSCLFNRNGKCVANGITLNAIKEKPYCVSFLKK